MRTVPGGIINRLTGVACLGLGVVSLLFATGLTPNPFLLPALAQVPAESLCQSAVCYVFCGALLIHASAVTR